MQTAETVELLKRLATLFHDWDTAASGASGDNLGPSEEERSLFLDELCALAGCDRTEIRGEEPWGGLFRLFSSRRTASPVERQRRERLLLRAYEALCDRDLPFAVSSALLRQYSAIKRASHSMPAVPPGQVAEVSAVTR